MLLQFVLLAISLLILPIRPSLLSTSLSSPQKLVKTYLLNENGQSTGEYINKVQQNLQNNGAIPKKGRSAFRVATYNIHFYTDISGNQNLDNMINDIKNMDASVIVLEEVDKDSPEKVINKLKKIGYKNIIYDLDRGNDGHSADTGNLVAAKKGYRMKHLKTLLIGRGRSAIVAKVKRKGREVVVIGTHLHHVWNEGHVRRNQAKSLLSYIRKHIVPKYKYYLLAGDMNEAIQYDGIQAFIRSGSLVETFHALGWNAPEMTCWAGTTIDFIFASPALIKLTMDAYLYHTVQSDHMPVMAGFRLFGNKLKSKKEHGRRY